MKFRKGDKVSLVGVVKYDSDQIDTDGDKRIFVTVGHDDLWLKPEMVKMVAPVFEVDDDVSWDDIDGTQVGTILAISNEHAWLDLGGGGYCTRMLHTISRVDRSDDDPA